MSGESGAVGGMPSPVWSEPDVTVDDSQPRDREPEGHDQDHKPATEESIFLSENIESSSELNVTPDSQPEETDPLCCSDQGATQPMDKFQDDASSVENKENEASGSTDKNTSKDFNPIYRELSMINGEINRLRKNQLKMWLRSFKLDTNGRKDVLQKRLKTHYRLKRLKEENIVDPILIQQRYYDYYVVIDFEATCDDINPHNFRHEIIEFPGVLVCTKRCKIIDVFHSYVRPEVNPRLTSFCTSLTGITQDKVNFAPMFPEVLQKFEEWLDKHKLTTKPEKIKFAIVTDGPWDMGRFLFQQCLMSNVPYPSWAVKWINIRKNYSNFYSTKRLCLKDMLEKLGLRFVGQPHCGLDDSRNIARVAMKLLKDGANMRVNERIHLRKDGTYNPKERVVHNISRHNFNGMRKKLLVTDKGNEEKCNNGEGESGGGDDSFDNKGDEDSGTDPEDDKPWVNLQDMEEFPDLMSKPFEVLSLK
ncbi:3'-5' exoribonuclease 1-like [Homarus americanus]|uniref:3'-5' exoribonuclease 1-like n=1 Tax=Homarus americanus TaxID=6706 RepID=A0A8J5N2Z4_HOMAM|nr:3'-5' exoribonuclease 1-like [Homarus americanus]KAG7172300.1 3'-5' exoribonuclease 1-like [Homarus americanus]